MNIAIRFTTLALCYKRNSIRQTLWEVLADAERVAVPTNLRLLSLPTDTYSWRRGKYCQLI